MRIIIFLFIYLLTLVPIYSKSLKTITYPFTAKELVFECEAWIPGETAVQQKAKKEVSCIRYIQSTINTYPLIKSQNNEKLSDLCLPTFLNLRRHTEVIIKYETQISRSGNIDETTIMIESRQNA